MPQLLIYYIQYQNRKSRLVQMPEVATGSVLRKSCSLKCCKIHRKLLCQRKIFKNTFFTVQLRTTASEMQTLQQRSDRCRLYLLQRAGCNVLLIWLKSESVREASHHSAFMGICLTISHTYQSYLADQLIDELFFWFLLQLNGTRRLGEYKVLSFCFLC